IRVNTSHEALPKRDGQTATITIPVDYVKMGDQPPRSWTYEKQVLRMKVYCRGPLPKFPYAFAVDLGTTNTCAAYWDSRNRCPVLVELIKDNTSTPTIVTYERKQPAAGERNLVIGKQAEQTEIDD